MPGKCSLARVVYELEQCCTDGMDPTQTIARREQERLQKAEQARRETERILREQRAATDAKEVRAHA